ncbi:DinB superfamily protein [Rubripirellula amarantea]|uniref:DinB superfamily protein n=2 Tax=Rubripirellula amarantea TaxID=2527999 RepID=A0A5C5WV14_9BACT|nr:DinB superfamily protein [Rubripirellula amarantea]
MPIDDNAPDPQATMQMLCGAVGQIKFARDYTLGLLEQTPRERWFDIPDGLCTNIAWQVGHLTVSQYGLLMFRLRGRADEDLELIPSRFRKAYTRGSTPSADASKQMSADELHERLCVIHTRAMSVLDQVTAETLLEPIDMPYAAYPNKLGAVLFCPLHEHIHAGQIGLIRRAMGLESVR